MSGERKLSRLPTDSQLDLGLKFDYAILRPKSRERREMFKPYLPTVTMSKNCIHNSNVSLPIFLTIWPDRD